MPSSDTYARIYAVVNRVPRGRVATYGQIATLAHLPLGAWSLGPVVLHPLALGYVATGCAMISKRLRIPKP